MLDETVCCENCRWWEGFSSSDTEEGSCHRYPPITKGLAYSGVECRVSEPEMEEGIFVITEADDFCGEFKEE